MLKIREFTDSSGALAAVYLRCTNRDLEIVRNDEALVLPRKALDAVMARYGDAFDPEAPITVVGTVHLDGGKTLRHVRHLAGYDVIARDYLVYDAPGVQPLCALSTTVSLGLEHLARIARR